MELLAIFVLKAAGEALVGLAVSTAGRHGYAALRAHLAQLQQAKRAGDEAEVVDAQQALEGYLHAHPDEADVLVEDFLQPQQPAHAPGGASASEEAELITVLEGYVAVLFTMISKTPPHVLAVPGSLCDPHGLTVIDTRPEGQMRLPRRYDDHTFFLLDAYAGWGWSAEPRMWIARPGDGHAATDMAQRLTHAFAHGAVTSAGRLAAPDRLCAATLAELSGGGEHTRRFGRVRVVRELIIELDTETALEQADAPPPTTEERVRAQLGLLSGQGEGAAVPPPGDYATRRRRVADEQAQAGLNEDYLQISGEGMRLLAQEVRDQYRRAQRAEADVRKAKEEQRDGILEVGREVAQQGDVVPDTGLGEQGESDAGKGR